MATSNPALTSPPESLEQLVAAAQVSGDFRPLWMRFVKTRFYVSIVRHANESAAGFDLWLSQHPESALASIHVSEQKAQLPISDKAEIIALSGADIVRRAPAGTGISLMLSSKTLNVASTRVEWLKQSLQASLDAAKQKQMAATFAQNSSISNTAISSIEPKISEISQAIKTPAVAVGITDIAALKPRFVAHEAMGIEMFVPEKWQEVRNEKTLKLVDHEANTIVEVSGLARDNMTLANWMAQRLQRVSKEMPYLVQMGDSYPVHGSEWRDRICASATEYRGRFHDDEEESIYLICCYRTDTRVAAICIRAKANVFEAQRGIYRWLLAQINITEASQAHINNDTRSTQRAHAEEMDDTTEAAPSVFSLSFSGRLGRLRFIAYAFLAMFPPMILMFLAILTGKSIGTSLILVSVLLMIIMQLRPTVLRLHDLNLSGKWMLTIFVFPIISGVMQRVDLIFYNQILLGIACLALYFVPGDADSNDFGSPCPPNSTVIKISAAIFFLLMIIGLGNAYRTQKTRLFESINQATNSGESGYGFSPEDKSFVINFPAIPIEKDLSNDEGRAAGLRSLKVYSVDAGKHSYLVQRMTFEVVPGDKSVVLDRLSDGMLQSNRGTLVYEEKTRINGLAARAARVRSYKGNFQDYRFMFAKTSLYVLVVESKFGQENAPDVTAFFDSFVAN